MNQFLLGDFDMRAHLVGFAPVIALAFVAGCPGTTADGPEEPAVDPVTFATECESEDVDDGITRPDGWTAVSHCKHAPPDYARIFGDGTQVLEMTLRMTDDDYAAMNADLDDLLQGGPGGFLPPEWLEACEGLTVGTACNVTEGPGYCFEEFGALFCLPQGGGLPPGWEEACTDLSFGDACTTLDGDGRCIEDGGFFFCLPDEIGFSDNTAACEGLNEFDACTIDDAGDGICFFEALFDALNCFPEDGGPGGPAQQDPCQQKDVGDGCAVAGLDGVCVASVDNAAFISCAVRGFGESNLSGVPDDAAAKFWDRKPAYVRTTVIFEETEWTDVGIRYKGNNGLASSRAPKYPLRLEFDQFEDDVPGVKNQRLYGFKELSLTNNQTDPSFLNQHAAASTFAKVGVPAPRTTPALVTLEVEGADPVTLGLYTLTEIPGKPLLDEVFGENDGNLYKPDGRGAHFVDFVEASFHKKSNKTAADFSDVQAVIAALHANDLDAEQWRTGLEATFDMNGFIRFLAANQLISNWDTYGGFAHNFYLYTDDADGLLHYIPWDFDLAFALSGPSDLSLLSFDGSWPLIQAVVHDPVYYYAYHQALVDVFQDLMREDTLTADVDTWVEAIRPFAENETSADAFNDAVGEMRFHIGEQRSRALDYLVERNILDEGSE